MFALPPLDPGFEMSVASHGMSKGIEQVDGPQVIPRAYLQVGDVQVGGQWKNITSTSADGEASAFVNINHNLGWLSLTLGAAYKSQTNADPGTDSNSLEFTGGLAKKFGKLSLKATAIYSPDDAGKTKQSLYVEGGPSYELTKTLRLSANIGHRSRANSPDYTSMNLGVTKSVFRAFSIDLRYYRTNRSELGDIYRRRIVLAGRWVF